MGEPSKSKSAILFIAATAVLIASMAVKDSEQHALRPVSVATASATPKAVSAVEILDLGRTQNDKGWPHAKLLITNRKDVAVLVVPRGIKQIESDGWRTSLNLSAEAVFALSSLGPLSGGEGVVCDVPFPQQTNKIWILEMVFYPQRGGLSGIVDRTKDKVQNLKSGGNQESYMGEPFDIESPPLRR